MKAVPAIAVLAFGVMLILAASPVTAQSRPPSPEDFAMAAAQSDAYEIDAARVAVLAAQDPKIRDFAKQMVQDHMMSSNSLKAAASKSNLAPPPDTPNSDQARMLSALQSLKGQEFDHQYIVQQVVAHQGALTVEEQYVSSGTDTNLRQAATAALPMIRHHLDAAKQLQSSMPQ